MSLSLEARVQQVEEQLNALESRLRPPLPNGERGYYTVFSEEASD